MFHSRSYSHLLTIITKNSRSRRHWVLNRLSAKYSQPRSIHLSWRKTRSTHIHQYISIYNHFIICQLEHLLTETYITCVFQVTQNEINAWISSFEKKINPFLEFKDKLELDEAKKLGLKDQEVETEKFIQVWREEEE